MMFIMFFSTGKKHTIKLPYTKLKIFLLMIKQRTCKYPQPKKVLKSNVRETALCTYTIITQNSDCIGER